MVSIRIALLASILSASGGLAQTTGHQTPEHIGSQTTANTAASKEALIADALSAAPPLIAP
jgi:hypothetical protein